MNVNVYSIVLFVILVSCADICLGTRLECVSCSSTPTSPNPNCQMTVSVSTAHAECNTSLCMTTITVDPGVSRYLRGCAPSPCYPEIYQLGDHLKEITCCDTKKCNANLQQQPTKSMLETGSKTVKCHSCYNCTVDTPWKSMTCNGQCLKVTKSLGPNITFIGRGCSNKCRQQGEITEMGLTKLKYCCSNDFCNGADTRDGSSLPLFFALLLHLTVVLKVAC